MTHSPRSMSRHVIDLPGGRSIAYVAAGDGPAIVAIHGAVMTLEDMALGPMTDLARHFRVIAVDRPGHGGSERAGAAEASVWRQAASIHEALGTMRVERPILLGHSAGGAVALAYAMQFPQDTAGVVALAPICIPEPRLEQILFGPRALPITGALIASAARTWTDPLLLPILWRAMFQPQSMPPYFETAFPFDLAARAPCMSADGEDALALGPDLVRSMSGYAACRVPVNILGGDADLVLNNNLHGRTAAQLLPQATFRLLRGMGHMFHHFQREEIVEAAIDLARR